MLSAQGPRHTVTIHRKSAKHVKMNRTSFVSQNVFKGLQQKGETEMLVFSTHIPQNSHAFCQYASA